MCDIRRYVLEQRHQLHPFEARRTGSSVALLSVGVA
jgi:hypothetical protein